jgi:hypothetical protein
LDTQLRACLCSFLNTHHNLHSSQLTHQLFELCFCLLSRIQASELKAANFPFVSNWNFSVPQYSLYRFTAFRNTLCFLIDLPVSCLCKSFLYFRNKYTHLPSSVNLIPIFVSILYQFLAVDDLPRLVFSSHSLIVWFNWLSLSIISFSCNPDNLKQSANVKVFIYGNLFVRKI